ncbi:pyrroline-5-carboxylate reductase [Lentibacillus saliphilus]|uniref:pyrroline-5-carboxylate reductase n=1 Tax=Lentibacillus saliphilus TaxID=2737028 RepID=UPI001C311133|nr:pyrroline-5-carboxylate reductase [Lentibacillus saliphilus]
MAEKIVFIGAGSMAEAMIAGLVDAQVLNCQNIYVTNKENKQRLKALNEAYGVTCLSDKQAALKEANMIILATKPHDAEAALAAIKQDVTSDQLVISVVAGLETTFIEQRFSGDIPVVRAMPNTSAAVGASATAICAGAYVQESHLKAAEMLLQTIGTTTVVAEKDMHAVTAISGSGPAYMYYLIEAMEKAALDAGLDRDVARSLLIQTVVGAGNMLASSSDAPALLRKKITSPNGTTEAGINTLQAHDFEAIIKACVESARARSVELGR